MVEPTFSKAEEEMNQAMDRCFAAYHKAYVVDGMYAARVAMQIQFDKEFPPYEPPHAKG